MNMTKKESSPLPGPEKETARRPAFHCTKCGACCRQLGRFGESYAWLDAGDGVCRYLDRASNLCTIYERRPLICRVEEGYDVFFSSIPYEEYLEKTYLACEMLRRSLAEKSGA